MSNDCCDIIITISIRVIVIIMVMHIMFIISAIIIIMIRTLLRAVLPGADEIDIWGCILGTGMRD